MSRFLTDERLRELHAIVVAQVRPAITNNSRRKKEGKPLKVPLVTLNGHEAQKLLYELLERRRKRSNASDHAKALMKMEVGDTILLPPLTANQLKSYRVTARRHLGVDAMWVSRKQSDGRIKVTRLPDGSKPKFADASAAMDKLCSMTVGQSCLFDKLPYSIMRADARVRMNQPQAKWTSTKMSSGRWRVRRIR